MGNNKKKCRKRKKDKMIEDETARQVKFTKLYQSLCKKVAEYAVAYGAQCAIITHSPRGDPVTFAYPSGSADAIVDRFLSGKALEEEEEEDAASMDSTDELNRGHEDAVHQLEDASKQESEVAETGAAPQWWWEDPVDMEGMGVEELKDYMRSLKDVKEKLLQRLAVCRDKRKRDETEPVIQNDGTGEKVNTTEAEENEIKGSKSHSDSGVNLDSPEDGNDNE